MSNDKMREEFEYAFAAYLNRRFPKECIFSVEILHDRSGEEYVSRIFTAAWWGWQASLAAAVVDLPKITLDVHCDAQKYMRDQCREAIETAGVKCK